MREGERERRQKTSTLLAEAKAARRRATAEQKAQRQMQRSRMKQRSGRGAEWSRVSWLRCDGLCALLLLLREHCRIISEKWLENRLSMRKCCSTCWKLNATCNCNLQQLQCQKLMCVSAERNYRIIVCAASSLFPSLSLSHSATAKCKFVAATRLATSCVARKVTLVTFSEGTVGVAHWVMHEGFSKVIMAL